MFSFQRVTNHSHEIRQPSPRDYPVYMDQDQPQIPSQDPRPLPNAPPKAIPIAPLVIQPIPKVENPFKLKDNELSRYISCTSCQPWTPPQKYREMKESDDAAKYLAHKKAYENKPPSIANIITSLSPPIIRRSNCQGHLLLAGFTKGHQETLSRLYSLIRSDGDSEWGGNHASSLSDSAVTRK